MLRHSRKMRDAGNILRQYVPGRCFSKGTGAGAGAVVEARDDILKSYPCSFNGHGCRVQGSRSFFGSYEVNSRAFNSGRNTSPHITNCTLKKVIKINMPFGGLST